MTGHDDAQPARRSLARLALIFAAQALIGVVLCLLALTFARPLLMCVDFLSGHVPARAQSRFLAHVFASAQRDDTAWLTQVGASPETLAALQQVRPHISDQYEIVLSDNLLGYYDNRVRFESGLVLYITYEGRWHACPDLAVTDAEITRNMRLVAILIEEIP